MKAVKIVAYQNMPNYRKPTSLMVRESYPLPPYSTIIGMVHAICGFESYMPMMVSVQGYYNSSNTELFTCYSFKPETKPEAGRHNLVIETQKQNHGMFRGMGWNNLMVDLYLLLHIIPENPDVADIIRQCLMDPPEYPSMGRWEDILRIDNVDLHDLEEAEFESDYQLKYDSYIPVNMFETDALLEGSRYFLNKKYEIDANGLRKWRERVEVVYAGRESIIYEDVKVLIDKDGDLVFPA